MEKRFISTPRPRVVCKDGVSLSIQASETAYCTPRGNQGPYTEMEVGFVHGAKVPDTWLEYSDDGEITSDVFGYVPVKLIQEFIDIHGGIDIAKSYVNPHGREISLPGY